MKKLSLILIISALLLSGCGEQPENNSASTAPTPSSSPKTSQTPEVKKTDLIKTMKTVTVDTTDTKKPVVTITLGNDKIIKAELYPDVAPITVENFVSLIESKFYDGLTFHRIEPGFVIQGGDPKGNGTGGSGENIKGEFASNGIENNLKHTKGVLSMARSQANDSASSQFFIMVGDAPHLDGQYAAFGKVTEGMDAVDEIVASK